MTESTVKIEMSFVYPRDIQYEPCSRVKELVERHELSITKINKTVSQFSRYVSVYLAAFGKPEDVASFLTTETVRLWAV